MTSPVRRAGSGRPRWLRAVLTTALLGSLAALCLAAAVRWALPLRTQPPDGPAGVATRIWTWEDATRPDGKGDPRSLTTQVWHPIDAPFQPRIPEGAEIPPDAGPIVVIVHGALGTRHSHLSLAHQLASEGWLAVAADHPEAALLSRQGRFGARFPPLAALTRWLDTAGLPTRERLAARATGPTLAILAEDARFLRRHAGVVLRQEGRPAAYVGYGLGGLAALSACTSDPTCAAVVTLDAPTELVSAPPAAPVLAITSASVPAATGLRPGDARVDLSEAGTLDLTDLPLQVRGPLLRLALSDRHTRGTGRSAVSIVPAVTAAWLDERVRGGPATFERAAARWPEAEAARAAP